MVALTASSKVDTRKKIIDVLGMHNCIEIVANPDRRNIKLHVKEVANDIPNSFTWLIDELKENNVNSKRVIIYCKSIRQCTKFFNFFKMELGNALYCEGKPKHARYRLVGMYHSSTDEDIKRIVSQSLNEENGYVRVVIATSALGMGVDVKGLHLVINFGPPNCIESYYQAFGRAGRDGRQSHAVLLYHGRQLRKCDSDMLSYLKHKGCRRKMLLNFFDVSSVNSTPVSPEHLCCDNCLCTCEHPTCKDFENPVVEQDKNATESAMIQRELVKEEQKEALSTILHQKREELFENLRMYHFVHLLILSQHFLSP